MSLCEQCGGRCCVGDIDVYATDMVYLDGALTESITGRHYNRIMKTGPDGKCLQLVDGRCAIYGKRPEICRMFQMGSECCSDFLGMKKIRHICPICRYQVNEN